MSFKYMSYLNVCYMYAYVWIYVYTYVVTRFFSIRPLILKVVVLQSTLSRNSHLPYKLPSTSLTLLYRLLSRTNIVDFFSLDTLSDSRLESSYNLFLTFSVKSSAVRSYLKRFVLTDCRLRHLPEYVEPHFLKDRKQLLLPKPPERSS